MKMPSFAALGMIGVGAALLTLIDIGRPGTLPDPVFVDSFPVAGPSQVTDRGVTLVSTTVSYPDDSVAYPAGPHADVINANCISCHSAGMALNQPPLSAAQWTDEVAKMRNVYKAPVLAQDVPAIVAYLTAMSAGAAPGVPTAVARPAGAMVGAASGAAG